MTSLTGLAVGCGVMKVGFDGEISPLGFGVADHRVLGRVGGKRARGSSQYQEAVRWRSNAMTDCFTVSRTCWLVCPAGALAAPMARCLRVIGSIGHGVGLVQYVWCRISAPDPTGPHPGPGAVLSCTGPGRTLASGSVRSDVPDGALVRQGAGARRLRLLGIRRSARGPSSGPASGGAASSGPASGGPASGDGSGGTASRR